MKTYKGISASPGIVIGKVFVFKHQKLEISDYPIECGSEEKEFQRFIKGRDLAIEQLNCVYNKALSTLGEDEAEIFEGHIELISDEDIEDGVKDLIFSKKMCAEKAATQVMEENAKDMESLDNPYMQERAADLRDIGKRLTYCIAGVSLMSLADIEEPVIIIAEDLTPSDTAQIDKDKVLGFACEVGGSTSHVAIMARTLELPALVGCSSVLHELNNGDEIILDASMGKIITDIDEDTRSEYLNKIKAFFDNKKTLEALKDLPAETLDGHRVELCANIGTDIDVEGAIKHGAEGVGLYRTEFLFMDKPQMPCEDVQMEAYRNVAQAIDGRGIIIRTIDIGGDKSLEYLDFPKELNPFLGWRAIRMCLDTPDIIITQLRAILRASVYGKLRIMFPMIISVKEIRKLKSLVEEVKASLKSEGIPFDENIEVGIMIETPASAVIAPILAKEVDFFSIGTNDLTQYTLAVDRGNEKIAELYQPMHPAVLTLIKNVIDASHAEGKWTGMCGELAGNEIATLLLLGLGLDEFSMSASSISRVKKIIRSVSYSQAKELSEKALSMSTADEIVELLNNYILNLE
ncbi:MAG: phosphoenolpyruvate--protein phosphotransferase [Pleomorphochaeta sp.]